MFTLCNTFIDQKTYSCQLTLIFDKSKVKQVFLWNVLLYSQEITQSRNMDRKTPISFDFEKYVENIVTARIECTTMYEHKARHYIDCINVPEKFD